MYMGEGEVWSPIYDKILKKPRIFLVLMNYFKLVGCNYPVGDNFIT